MKRKIEAHSSHTILEKYVSKDLKESRGSHLLSDVIDFLPDAILAIDREGKVITWNKAMEKMTGASAADMMGKGDYEYALPFYGIRRPILVDLVLMPQEEIEGKYDLLQREGNTLTVEIFIPTFGTYGSYLWAKAAPLYDSQGEIAGAIESIRDFTERKRSEEETASMKQRLAEVIDFLPDATFAIDNQGTVLTWNKAMEKMTGVSAADMMGKGDYEYALPFYGIRRPILADLVLLPDEKIEKKYPGLQRDGKTLISEIFVPTFGPKGSFIWAKAAPLYNSLGSIVGAIESIRDITDMRRTEQTLERSKSELRIASEIQRSFLPERLPPVSGFDLAATTIPAREVGGDFYDLIIKDENLQFVIADVSGKGVPAALFMALSRTIVRACASTHESVAERLSCANNMIVADSRSVASGMFVTLFFANLNKKERSLVYANAGHNPPLLFRATTSSIEMMEVTGVALGMGPDMEYEQRRVAIESGDILFLYTDGVVEAMNDKEELFGQNRLRSSLAAATKQSAQGILDSILCDLCQFTEGEEQSDDITAIVIKVG